MKSGRWRRYLDTIFTILISILIFGLLIFIHELGHYLFARIFKVTILEFSIGMGPKIVSYKSKKTGIVYAISAIPFGGYVAMAGEERPTDEPPVAGQYGSVDVPQAQESLESDPNTFDKKPAWQRLIITVAGAAMNLLAGFTVMIIYTSLSTVLIGSTTVADFPTNAGKDYNASTQGIIESGDRIIKVNGKSVSIYDELSYEIMRGGNKPVDLTVVRDGEEITLDDVVFPTVGEQGQVLGVIDFRVYRAEKDIGTVMKYSLLKGVLLVRMCWESLFDLITGRYSLQAVSGPVGISGAIGDAAKIGIEPLLYIAALISINLGVMNLLPIPALDGGRTLTTLIEMITRKKLPPKVENAINAVGLVLLLGLSFIILIKDVLQLII